MSFAAAPAQLFAGGSGVVPLMAIIRERARHDGPPPMRLVYSVRSPEQVIYADELARRAEQESLGLDLVYTRQSPPGWTGAAGRLDRDAVGRLTPAPGERPACYVCARLDRRGGGGRACGARTRAGAGANRAVRTQW